MYFSHHLGAQAQGLGAGVPGAAQFGAAEDHIAEGAGHFLLHSIARLRHRQSLSGGRIIGQMPQHIRVMRAVITDQAAHRGFVDSGGPRLLGLLCKCPKVRNLTPGQRHRGGW